MFVVNFNGFYPHRHRNHFQCKKTIWIQEIEIPAIEILKNLQHHIKHKTILPQLIMKIELD
jgi:hypothetical protein